QSGIALIRSAGNSGGSVGGPLVLAGYLNPEHEDLMLVVTNLRDNLEISDSSTRCGEAKWYCVSAPGSNINSTVFNGNYSNKTGTSMASPHVAGVWALLAERFPYLRSENINDIIKTASKDLGEEGVDDIYGWGIPDVQKALAGPGQLLGNFD